MRKNEQKNGKIEDVQMMNGWLKMGWEFETKRLRSHSMYAAHVHNVSKSK